MKKLLFLFDTDPYASVFDTVVATPNLIEFLKEVTDDQLKAAIDRVRELYRRLRKVPASQPDKRAEIWRTQVAPDPALARGFFVGKDRVLKVRGHGKSAFLIPILPIETALSRL